MQRFDPKHMDRLLGSERKRWQDPEAVIAGLGLRPGMVVADVGAGPGFFTLPLAEATGPAGKVLAVDVEAAMLERLQERAAAAGLHNIETVLSAEDSLPLSASTVDAALMVNVLHEMEGRATLLRQILAALRQGAPLAVVEWNKDRTDVGPPAEVRLSSTEVTALLEKAGYEQVTEFPVGPYHYGLRALKPRRQ